ncbi:hypothetical protein HL658_35605 [Azospirillum sp. RWY-5-1]|uniref:Uncharacterized protein n=1 Tax=Azospirillum oleiclasticum TaxID=2735135 RepID=A0ABX2TL61_9PROT|nr:hypothetical protein [Azospirillum oleiclasticum]NYZ17898.1 hypothetical protein [Azospirillum oleiclasticum]NYZ25106.1 hypothetical protein [Azospirillum oleiclasticum]
MAKVFFPMTGNKDLATVDCLPNDTPQPTDAVAQVIGHPTWIKEVLRTLTAARSGTGHDIGRKVKVKFRQAENCDGNSFQLALAVSDRMLLEGAPPGKGRVFATGEIDPAGEGAVLAIDGFDAKIELLLDRADPGDVFAFPLKNLQKPEEVTQKTLDGLAALRERGLIVCPVGHIEELGFLWTAGKSGASGGSAVAAPM